MLHKLVQPGAALLGMPGKIEPEMKALTPCPFCKRQPTVEICEPWDAEDGPQPWYAGCYQVSPREHFIGGNGATEAEAVAEWERLVAERMAAADFPVD